MGPILYFIASLVFVVVHMLSTLEDADLNELTSSNQLLINYANDLRLGLQTKPSQSNFRVLCILVLRKDNGSLQIIKGANCEQGYIGGAICAERAAICQLRFIHDAKIEKVVVVTDSKNPLSPGALCREFLTSVCAVPSQTTVIMGDCAGSSIIECNLSDLWPFPFLYRMKTRSELPSHFQTWAQEKKISKSSAHILDPKDIDAFASLRQHATACLVMERFEEIHPLNLAAAVLFSDGTVESAWQLKALEFGCSLDPVSQLLAHIERRRASGSLYCSACYSTRTSSLPSPPPLAELDANIAAAMIAAPPTATPTAILMIDQVGVCHAPFAQGRSLLAEHGYGAARVFVHDAEGILRVVRAADLLPPPPGDAKFLSHDDFL